MKTEEFIWIHSIDFTFVIEKYYFSEADELVASVSNSFCYVMSAISKTYVEK